MLRIYPVVVLATWSCIPLLASRAMSTQAGSSKVIRFLRHGQAMHNINAERMRDTGCSHEVFLQAMKDDDHFDSPLTDLGRQQAADTGALPACQAARATVDLVVASPLSRALDTADLAFPTAHTPKAQGRRECNEQVREILGFLVNGKRRKKSELALLYPHWGFDEVTDEEDALWEAWGDAQLEDSLSTQERAHACLEWLWNREERDIALVAHGGIFSLLTNDHSHVECGPGVGARFANCELRSCRLELVPGDDRSTSDKVSTVKPAKRRFRLTLMDAVI